MYELLVISYKKTHSLNQNRKDLLSQETAAWGHA